MCLRFRNVLEYFVLVKIITFVFQLHQNKETNVVGLNVFWEGWEVATFFSAVCHLKRTEGKIQISQLLPGRIK